MAVTNKYTQGLQSCYILGVFVPTAEEVTWNAPKQVYTRAESNNGFLNNVLKWEQVQGKLKITIVHYDGLDFDDLFSNNVYFNINLIFRSGDTLSIKDALLDEAASNTIIAGTTELSFSFLEYDFDPASND